ncbi:MAG TPA: AhpC/TSA family protein [Candidatus Alistipes avicola]|uniref:AhpC/TSA family protein n=1 Tax=Candidatus Alistipes avicola TaxID=2838432 RepID=A0A9D2IE31_9BACT|nr:TlpA disulfide reductase family protein [uncultured Alistipes sp.]HJA98402.1 AhpC/TSA family protein [Candidatus Alistipes avicola]
MNHRFITSVFCGCVIFLTSCHSSTVKISGRLVGSDCRTVYVEQETQLGQTVIDSATVDSAGNFLLKIKEEDETPSLYNLVCNAERIPLFLAGGDHVTINAVGRVLPNYTVQGSAESELLRQFYQPFVAGLARLDELASLSREEALNEEGLLRIETAYKAEYLRIKREQLKFIIEHQSSLAAVYALYQRLPGDVFLFNLDGDLIYYRMVADALEESYPQSPYLPLLASEIARMETRINLVSSIAETGYPDLEMLDMFGNKVRLSSLQGKVILVEFWSAERGNSNALNAELKELYDRYADRGFEIYQVGIDTSKQAWVTAVQEQRLPWISVSDFKGEASPALGLYAVQKLPSNFLINREGVVIARDLYGDALEKALEAQF